MNAVFSDDSRYVQACRAGDDEAFTPLVRRYQNAAYGGRSGVEAGGAFARGIPAGGVAALFERVVV